MINDGITNFERLTHDFKNLYNCEDNNNFDERFYNRAKTHKQEYNIDDQKKKLNIIIH